MSITLDEEAGGRILLMHATGRLTRGDYERVLPAMEQCVLRNGKVRLLCVFEHIKTWEEGALVCEAWFQSRHANDIERIAIVDDTDWEESLPDCAHPGFKGELRYFSMDRAVDALSWIEEGVGPTSIHTMVGRLR
ncbi:MAG: hypothetical protein GC159_02840 [Phycisphaera sp.]|nr:hypothetical protein [Phycisphaera sp.]